MFWTKQTQRTIVVCAIDWSLIGINQFLYFAHQHSEKHIDIDCKVTFGFKYSYKCLFFHFIMIGLKNCSAHCITHSLSKCALIFHL